jgi:energy-coupling factor transport system substrate-specific component
MTTKDIAIVGLLGALLIIIQVGLGFLPNIELVSLFILVYSLVFGKKALYMIYIFVLIEGVLYGFGIWWIIYLYIWTILWLLVMLFRKNSSLIYWAIIAGVFGLFFGALSSIPYFFIGGIEMGFTYWVSGIPFDIIHCISNFIVTLILFKPLTSIIKRLYHGNQKDQIPSD